MPRRDGTTPTEHLNSYFQGIDFGYILALNSVPTLIVEIALYSINLPLTITTSIVLLRRSPGERLVHKWLLMVLMLMFIVAMAYILWSIIGVYSDVLSAASESGGNIPILCSSAQQFLLLIQAALGDSVTIWRCYNVLGRSIIVIILPALTALASFTYGLYLASAGSRAVGLVGQPLKTADLLQDLEIWGNKSWIWAAIAIVCTVYCTVAISFKIYSSARLMEGNKLFLVIFVIETTLIYTLGIIAYVVLDTDNSIVPSVPVNVLNLLMGAVVQLPPIVLCLLLLQTRFYNSENQAVRYMNTETRRPWAAVRRFVRISREVSASGDMPTSQVVPVTAHDLMHTIPAEPQHSDVDDTPSVSDSESDTIGRQKETSSVLDIT
ncbi:hypothetical protein DENSPDRAFT_127638 [Dentipellis sp. KUC8613]|nr:hypothetical protein DENSPDRAFT_127638 [Dentipellis sp. KUC8613]